MLTFWWRLVPAGLVVLMLVIRSFWPGFLAVEVLWFITLFWLIFTPLLYLAAYLLTPPFVAWLTRMGRRYMILPVVFIAFGLGFVFVFELAYNGLFHHLLGFPALHLWDALSATIAGPDSPSDSVPSGE